MPYTLLKFLLWFGLAALVGGVIGWLLRSVKSRGELATVRPSGADEEEIARLRQRLANMDEVVAERDRLRIKVAELRTVESHDVAPEPVAAEPVAAGDDASGPVDATSDDGESDTSDPDDPATAGPDDDRADDDAGTDDRDAAAEAPPEVLLDLDVATNVLGKPVELNDLTVVEGIGPKISELCRGIKIETWRDLADSSLDELRSMLEDAGPRYQVHKPDSWPEQAELLATGQWEAFKSLTDALAADR